MSREEEQSTLNQQLAGLGLGVLQVPVCAQLAQYP
jgi:hypothetical protein